MQVRILPVLFVLGISSAALAIEDTIENRRAEAGRYMDATPPESMIGEMTSSMAMNLPPEDRETFRALMTEYIDYAYLNEVVLEALVRHFSADELAALADFYGSPEGQSAMGKFGGFMAETMPAIQAEVMRAVGVAQKDQAEANRMKPDPQ